MEAEISAMTEKVGEIADVVNIEELLSAEALVSLRKSADESVRNVIGEKFYTRSEVELENDAVESSLVNYKDTLNQKRIARTCDLMQAEWNEELKVSIANKLKGKFVQHMGHNVNGQTALSPEESLFLLENGCIEIMNGEFPMSTEEGYSVMLTGALSTEKYQVYSQLSQLGFIVVSHQTKLGVTSYEKRINLDKHRMKKKRKCSSRVSEEPDTKRLTFTGALSGEPDMNTVSDTSVSLDHLVNVKLSTDVSPLDFQPCGEDGISPLSESIGDAPIIETNKVTKESELDQSNINELISAQIGNYTDTPLNEAIATEENPVQNEKNGEPISSEALVTSTSNVQTEDIDIETVDMEPSGEKQLESTPPVNNNEVVNAELAKKPGPLSEVSAQSNDDDSLTSSESSSDSEKGEMGQRIISKPWSATSCASPINNEVDVMDIDSQNTEISCKLSENSGDGFGANIRNVINAPSPVAYCLNVSSIENPNSDSNSDIMSCSSTSSNALSLNVSSEDSLSGKVYEDDEVTLIEVTKKETKPLAVIDLLSEDEGHKGDPENSGSDDEITVVKVCSASKVNNNTQPKAGGSRKFYPCKKEERSSPVTNPKFLAPSTSVIDFPDLFRKDVACVAQPPLNLLPNNVKPSKEAYVINLKPNHEQQTRLWNSYRDMQEYQRSRRQNRHSDRPSSGFQGREPKGWADRNLRPYDISSRDHRQNYNHGRTDASERNSHSLNNYGHSRDMKMNSFNSSQNSSREQGLLNLPNSAPMNSMVAMHQNMNVSMVGNQAFPPLAHGFPSSMPNMTHMGTAHIMAEVQRTAITVARNMLSSMLGQNLNHNLPSMAPFNPFQPPVNGQNYDSPSHTPYPPPPVSTAAYNSQVYNGESFSMQNNRRNFRDQQRRFHTGSPFPCRYRDVRSKKSWGDVKAAVGDDKESYSPNGSDVEEVPPSPTEVLWDPNTINPLVKPGIQHPVSSVLKLIQGTQMAKLNQRNLSDRCFESVAPLEITFDVYLPGTNYKKTCPGIPSHRILVVRSTDPVPRYAKLAFLQRKWNDGAMFQLAVVDNGDISFMSLNSVCLPVIIPHEE